MCVYKQPGTDIQAMFKYSIGNITRDPEALEVGVLLEADMGTVTGHGLKIPIKAIRTYHTESEVTIQTSHYRIGTQMKSRKE